MYAFHVYGMLHCYINSTLIFVCLIHYSNNAGVITNAQMLDALLENMSKEHPMTRKLL